MKAVRILTVMFVCLFLSACGSRTRRNDSISSRSDRRIAQSSYLSSYDDSSSSKNVQGKVIFLDPGHGGRDIGTESRFSIRLQEKVLALETAKMVQGYLKQMGYQTRMTRTQDVFIPLQKRVEIANKANAFLFISIHFNSAPNSSIRGAEVFYYKNPKEKDRSTKSKKLADCILLQLKESLPTKARGVKHGDFCVIRETVMPSVLVESAFLSNHKEVKLLTTKAYKQRIAKAIANGVDQFLKGN